MAMNFTSYVTRLAHEAILIHTNVDLPQLVPATIDYAEQRLYRDLNLINTTVVSTTVSLTANARRVAMPQSVTGSTQGFQSVTAVSVMLNSLVRVPLARSWQDYIDFVYPSDASSGAGSVPRVYAIAGSSAPDYPGPRTILLGPPAGTTYSLEITGTVRPTALSSVNTETILTRMYPDLFMAASMTSVASYMRGLGASADPQLCEMQYQKLLESAVNEQGRARFSTHVNPTSVPTSGG